MRKGSLKIALMAMSICLISIMSVSAWAVPGLVNYQGKLTDIDHNPLEGGYIMTFRIYSVQFGGMQLWHEIQTVAVSEGVYSVQLGKNTPFPGDLFDLDELYLEIAIFNSSQNQDETLSPRQRLSSTPYAMKAAKAADADTLAGQPSSYYAVASEVQRRITGACGPGYSIREINSDGSVVCEIDDVDDAVSNPNGTYNGMSVGYANIAGSASNAGNADTVDGKHASDFTSPSTDAGRSGVAPTLYEGNNSLSSLYINEGQANSITSAMIKDNGILNADISGSASIAPSKIDGTAWTSKNDGPNTGLNADLLDGFDSAAFMVIKGCYVSYSVDCLSGFTNMGSAGSWGRCYGYDNYDGNSFFRPPGGGCPYGWDGDFLGFAYVCCQ